MKKYCLIFVLTLFKMSLLLSQSECDKKVYVAYNAYKEKDTDNMYYNWKRAYNECPGHDRKIYVVGAKIFQTRIKNSSDERIRQNNIDSLMLMYDERIKYFDAEKYYVMGRKGADVLKYGDLENAFELLEKSVIAQGNKSEPHVLWSYFESVILLYSEKKKTIDDILEKYSEISGIIEFNISLGGKKSSLYEKYYNKIESQFEPFATCELLVEMYSSKLDSYLNDNTWLKRTENVLRKKKCDNTEVYFKISERLYDLEPSESSANAMANMLAKKKRFSSAIKFYFEAININPSSPYIHEYNYGLSLCYYSIKDYRNAVKYAKIAINKKSNWGSPYILIGDVFIESVDDCARNSFEVALMYCGAIEYYLKSKDMDKSSRNIKIADKKIRNYESYFPNTDQITKEGYNIGQKYSLDCFLKFKIIIANNVSALQRFR